MINGTGVAHEATCFVLFMNSSSVVLTADDSPPLTGFPLLSSQMLHRLLPLWTRRNLSISSPQTSAGDEASRFVGAFCDLVCASLSGPINKI